MIISTRKPKLGLNWKKRRAVSWEKWSKKKEEVEETRQGLLHHLNIIVYALWMISFVDAWFFILATAACFPRSDIFMKWKIFFKWIEIGKRRLMMARYSKRQASEEKNRVESCECKYENMMWKWRWIYTMCVCLAHTAKTSACNVFEADIVIGATFCSSNFIVLLLLWCMFGRSYGLFLHAHCTNTKAWCMIQGSVGKNRSHIQS